MTFINFLILRKIAYYLIPYYVVSFSDKICYGIVIGGYIIFLETKKNFIYACPGRFQDSYYPKNKILKVGSNRDLVSAD